MSNKYLAKIIAKDSQGLRFISACCSQAKVKVSDLRYLKSNQIFLIFLQRLNIEKKENKEKINSVCKFEYVESVKSKKIDQKDTDLTLELLAIDLIKNKDRFEINLIFNNNSFITLFTEIVEVTLEDQNKT
tara:strand:- start:144 stop:536 length:393 start_codon:yes stop_codon:yes gene_type:complete